jgi:hypothetical protein
MGYVDAGGLGRAVKIACVRELERAPYSMHGAGVFERQIVDVVGHHDKARRITPAGMVEPQKQHPR